MSTDYAAPAEVYANRERGARKPLFYRKFASLAEALQFSVEDLPSGMINVLLETEEDRFDAAMIRTLYEAEEYPLPRTGARPLP